MPVPDSLEILLISGSLRAGSVNTAVLRTAALLADDNVQTTLYDRLRELPHFNPDDDPEGGPMDPAVSDLRTRLGASDAVLLCTPEYAGALPGSFKNLLEWTVGGGETYGKPVAWINASASAAPTGGADAHESLRKVLGYTGVDLVEAACRQIPVPRSAVGEDGLVTDPELRRQIGEVVALVAGHVAGASAQRTPLQAGDGAQRADAAFFAALLEGDVPALEELLAEDFVIVDVSSASAHPRAAFLEAIQAGAVSFEAIETHPEDTLVRHYGDSIAIIVGRTTMAFRGDDGQAFRADSRYTHVVQAERGAWRLVSAQGTTIPDES